MDQVVGANPEVVLLDIHLDQLKVCKVVLLDQRKAEIRGNDFRPWHGFGQPDRDAAAPGSDVKTHGVCGKLQPQDRGPCVRVLRFRELVETFGLGLQCVGELVLVQSATLTCRRDQQSPQVPQRR